MSRLSRWVLSHKLVVVLFWVVIAGTGLATVTLAVNALSFQITVPGKPGFETNRRIVQRYGNGGHNYPVVAVVTVPQGHSVTGAREEAQMGTAFAALQQALPGARIVSYATTHNPAFLSRDGRTTFGLIYAAGPPGMGTPGLAETQHVLPRYTVDGSHFHITGIGPLSLGSSSGGVGVLGEIILGAGSALLILIFVFGSVLAVVPLLMAMVAIPTTYLLIWGLTTVTEVSFIVQYLIGILGLGVGIDYSLLMVTRWREELARGRSNEDAVRKAMETAGVSVIFSGTTVAIGLIALLVLPLPFLRSVGIGGMLIPLVSVVAALTLLPVLLATVGPRMDWPARHRNYDGRFWAGWAKWVIRHSRISAAAALIFLGALVLAASTISMGSPRAAALAKTGDAHAGLVALQNSGIGAGALTPMEVLVRGGNGAAVAESLGHVVGVRGAVAPALPSWQRGGTSVVDVFSVVDGNSSEGHAVLQRVQSASRQMSSVVGVGGAVAEDVDFVSAAYGSFPLMVLAIAVLTFLLLVRAFRSIVLPLKAVLLNIVSVAAAWGVLVLIWQNGFGSKPIWGIQSTGSIESWIPLTVFAFLFGLSMDYEVFLLTRMREEYDAAGSTEDAIVYGTAHTGRLITSAALILCLAFVSLTSAPITDVKMMGTGLGAGILLDATVIRMLLVPAMMKLFGQWNWWLPAPAARILRVPVLESNSIEQEEMVG